MVAIEWDAQLDKRRGIVPGLHFDFLLPLSFKLFTPFRSIYANNDFDLNSHRSNLT
jgi:hypothetical protein